MSLLSGKEVSKKFKSRGRVVHALRSVQMSVEQGEILGIVGESGSGKSTLARILTGSLPADAGVIRINGSEYRPAREKPPKWLRENVQMIFQNAAGSFHPRKTLGRTILDAAVNFRIGKEEQERKKLILDLMDRCGLPPEIYDRYPWEVSGGQCQRAAIVRALIVKPKILILDEATSALDVLVQQNIVKLLLDIQKETGMSMVFITHDLALISSIAGRLLIMKDGEVVEEGGTRDVLTCPRQEYTVQLLNSIL